MTRIYEALKRAETERAGPEGGTPPPLETATTNIASSLREKLIAAARTIEAALPDQACRTLVFVGTRNGEGASTLAREFAKVGARELRKRVVLIDCEGGLGGHHEHFGLAMGAGLDAVLAGQADLDEALSPAGDDLLRVGRLMAPGGSAASVVCGPDFGNLMDSIRNSAQWVLFDAPSASVSSDVFLLAPETDGVVVVVEAEKTRWQVVGSLRTRIAMQGGTVLGVILNRRKHYIPSFIYQRM